MQLLSLLLICLLMTPNTAGQEDTADGHSVSDDEGSGSEHDNEGSGIEEETTTSTTTTTTTTPFTSTPVMRTTLRADDSTYTFAGWPIRFTGKCKVISLP